LLMAYYCLLMRSYDSCAAVEKAIIREFTGASLYSSTVVERGRQWWRRIYWEFTTSLDIVSVKQLDSPYVINPIQLPPIDRLNQKSFLTTTLFFELFLFIFFALMKFYNKELNQAINITNPMCFTDFTCAS